MGLPSFWYYPSDSLLVEVALPAKLTEFLWIPLRDRRSGWTVAGAMKSANVTGRLRVSITLGPFNDTGVFQHLAYQLESMSAHLERGGPVSFAADRDKAWLSSAEPVTGWTNFYVGENVCSAYNAAATLASGDMVCLESPNPTMHREYLRASSLSSTSGLLMTNDRVGYEYAEGATVRHRDFFPVLYMPEDFLGTSVVAHDHRLIFTLDLTLEQGVDGQFALTEGSDDSDEPGRRWTGGLKLHDVLQADSSGGLDHTASPGHSLQEIIGGGGGASRYTLTPNEFDTYEGALPSSGASDWLES